MKVSILIAVYNAEKYLRQCLDSLVGQTHRDIEIICVDDASTDASWQILQEYARKDERIRMMRQPVNKGQAEARNEGLKVASGDYVTMVDSDDWLAADAMEQACQVAMADEENDCVLLDVCHYDDVSGKSWTYDYRTSESSFTGEEAFRLSLDWSIHGLYMVRRAIHQACPYDTSCRLYSDDNTTRLHFLRSRRVSRCKGVYYYRKHEASMTHAISPLRFQYLRANLSMKQTMLAEGVDEELLNQYEEHRWLNLIGMWVFYWENYQAFTAENREEIKKELRYCRSTIEVQRLPERLKSKFGYIPFERSRILFERQVQWYAFLRRCYYRLKGFKPDSV